MNPMTFDLRPLQFEFLAKQSVHFPIGKASNVVRSALGVTLRQISCVPECRDAKACALSGDCIYARLFEPTGDGSGPSGLMDRPRPFVIRASKLDGCTISEGETFQLGVHLFELHPHIPLHLIRAFARLAQYGLGPRHGAVELRRVWIGDANGEAAQELFAGGRIQQPQQLPVLSILLTSGEAKASRIRVEFRTPTELKGDGAVAGQPPPFQLLMARIRDRVSNLRLLYGNGPLSIDFAEFGNEAAKVAILEAELRHAGTQRFSVRSGQSHSIGGILGKVTYAGELSRFVPFLRAARWTGVGKHTVWGNGERSHEIAK